MPGTFYEILTVVPDVDDDQLKHAYQQRLAVLVRKLREAREQAQDPAPLEEDRVALEEAWAVLSDPARRQRYDRFLEVGRSKIPEEAEELWSRMSEAMVDPSARATLELARLLTDLVSDAPAGSLRPRKVDESTIRVPSPRADSPPPPPAVSPSEAPISPMPEPAQATLSLLMSPPSPEIPPHGAYDVMAVDDGPEASFWAGSALIGPSSAGGASMREGGEPGRSMDSAMLATLVFNHGYSGELVRRVRVARNITLEQVAESTRISMRYLEAIEGDEYTRLPATTFVRGYLKEVARIVGLDAEALVGGYLARMNRARG